MIGGPERTDGNLTARAVSPPELGIVTVLKEEGTLPTVRRAERVARDQHGRVVVTGETVISSQGRGQDQGSEEPGLRTTKNKDMCEASCNRFDESRSMNMETPEDLPVVVAFSPVRACESSRPPNVKVLKTGQRRQAIAIFGFLVNRLGELKMRQLERNEPYHVALSLVDEMRELNSATDEIQSKRLDEYRLRFGTDLDFANYQEENRIKLLDILAELKTIIRNLDQQMFISGFGKG